MDPPQNTLSPYFDFSAGDDESIAKFLTSQDDSISYPISPISPPAEYLMPQYSMQMPNPMESNSPSPMVAEPTNEEDTTTVSVSTVFHPGAHAIEPDTTFYSSDKVLFYVHSQVLNGASPSAFHRVLKAHHDSGQVISAAYHQVANLGYQDNYLIHIPDTSSVLNIILHLLYGTSAACHSPSLATLVTAVDRMPFYEIVPKHHIVPRTPLYDLVLTHAPLFPIEVYSLAGQHDLQELAVATSSHLLSYTLSNMSDELAQRMGALYLKRLLCLHLDRFNALKNIVLSPPHPHPATKECSFVDQKRVTRAWALAAAYLAWDARPDANAGRPVHPQYAKFISAASGKFDLRLMSRGITKQDQGYYYSMGVCQAYHLSYILSPPQYTVKPPSGVKQNPRHHT